MNKFLNDRSFCLLLWEHIAEGNSEGTQPFKGIVESFHGCCIVWGGVIRVEGFFFFAIVSLFCYCFTFLLFH